MAAGLAALPPALASTPAAPGVSWSPPLTPHVPAGDYAFSIPVRSSGAGAIAGEVAQAINSTGPLQRVATFHLSTGTVTAQVRISGPDEVFRVATSGPAAVGRPTLTPAHWGILVRGTTFVLPGGGPATWHGVNTSPWTSDTDIVGLHRSTRANLVRVPVSECMWFPSFGDYRAGYRSRIIDEVDTAARNGMTVIVDLHWACHGRSSYHQDGFNTYDQVAPDAQSVTFWRDAARAFKDNPAVMFELFNEPQLQDDATYPGGRRGDVVWRSGGTVSYGLDLWKAPGMQELADAIRSTGATNTILADGTRWASSLAAVTSRPLDGTNVAYAYHAYDHRGDSPSAHSPTLDQWVAPVIDPRGPYAQAALATEFGTDQADPAAASYFRDTINWIERHAGSWVAWGWYPARNDAYGLLDALPAQPTRRGVPVMAAL